MAKDNRNRSYSERGEPLPNIRFVSIETKALTRIEDSLRLDGLFMDAKIEASSDEFGSRISVVVGPRFIGRALKWLATFGRSYGPVRIYVVEAE